MPLSFKHWCREVLSWTILQTNLSPQQQAAATCCVLRGEAQTLVRDLPARALLQGGIINGIVADPVTFLMHHLGERFAPLGEESRLQATTALFGFQRQHNARIDSVLQRFDSIRQQAKDFECN